MITYRYAVYRAGILLSVTAVITAYFGAQLIRVLDPDLIRVIFGVVLIYVGLRVVITASNSRALESAFVSCFEFHKCFGYVKTPDDVDLDERGGHEAKGRGLNNETYKAQ